MLKLDGETRRNEEENDFEGDGGGDGMFRFEKRMGD